MKLDHVFVIVAPSAIEGGTDDVIAAYLDEQDARGALKAHPGARIERAPLAPPSGSGIHRNSQAGVAEVEACLDDAARVPMRHAVTTCQVAVNAFAASARLYFPPWSTIQANGDRLDVHLLEGTEAHRTDASVDMLARLAMAMATQTKALVRMVQDIEARRRGGKPLIEVVPGLPVGLRR
jgi:hypothetical protein